MKKKFNNGNRRWYFVVILGFLLVGLGVGVEIWRRGWDGKSDLKLAVISSDNLAMISISPVRDMVNVLVVDKEVMTWVPGGLGWYRADKIRRLLDQEKGFTDYGSIFFYNFGFVADKVVFFDTFDDWDSNKNLIPELGLFGWMKYLFWQNSVVVGREEVSGDRGYAQAILKEIMMRDFGDDRVLTEDTRLSVYSTSTETGLAGFVAERLEWVGFSVMEISNSEETVEECLIVYSPLVEKKYGFGVLKSLFNNCLIKSDDGLGENEVFLYFGDGFGRMLKYSNYVRSF